MNIVDYIMTRIKVSLSHLSVGPRCSMFNLFKLLVPKDVEIIFE
jgi:hypothetical protein